MKNFKRNNLLVSLCGLNCGLCPMHLDNYCPGCGGGDGNQSCKIARCSMEHGGIEYCYLCDEYPCDKYDGIELFDSFITHHNQLNDMEKIKETGIEIYQIELVQKMELLNYLLENYNDGRRKNLFCIAINLLDLTDSKLVVDQLIAETGSKDMTIKEKAIYAANLFQSMAIERDIVLKLNKKERK